MGRGEARRAEEKSNGRSAVDRTMVFVDLLFRTPCFRSWLHREDYKFENEVDDVVAEGPTSSFSFRNHRPKRYFALLGVKDRNLEDEYLEDLARSKKASVFVGYAIAIVLFFWQLPGLPAADSYEQGDRRVHSRAEGDPWRVRIRRQHDGQGEHPHRADHGLSCHRLGSHGRHQSQQERPSKAPRSQPLLSGLHALHRANGILLQLVLERRKLRLRSGCVANRPDGVYPVALAGADVHAAPELHHLPADVTGVDSLPSHPAAGPEHVRRVQS